MAHLTIIRGLPGSGKSTLAKSMGVPVFEADDWFTDASSGKYLFVHGDLAFAHSYCFKRAEQCLRKGFSCVVANTFTRHWEYNNYILMCYVIEATYNVKVATGNFQNIHGCPQETIDSMKNRWEI